jgi:hypothetical protein
MTFSYRFFDTTQREYKKYSAFATSKFPSPPELTDRKTRCENTWARKDYDGTSSTGDVSGVAELS